MKDSQKEAVAFGYGAAAARLWLPGVYDKLRVEVSTS
jgi:hypothetical protein